MSKPKILVFSGSARRDSVNQKLATVAAEMAREAGAEVTLISLADYPMPLYDGDLEDTDGLPENAVKLKALFVEHDALLLACPEYNSSITPLLKNTIDWVSRPATDDEPSLSAYTDKVAGLLAASHGGLGGMRGLVHVHSILGNIGVTVIPQQFALGGAFQAFDESGDLLEDRSKGGVEKVVSALVKTTAKLAE